MTSITQNDIISTLQSLNLVKYWKASKFFFCYIALVYYISSMLKWLPKKLKAKETFLCSLLPFLFSSLVPFFFFLFEVSQKNISPLKTRYLKKEWKCLEYGILKTCWLGSARDLRDSQAHRGAPPVRRVQEAHPHRRRKVSPRYIRYRRCMKYKFLFSEHTPIHLFHCFPSVLFHIKKRVLTELYKREKTLNWPIWILDFA